MSVVDQFEVFKRELIDVHLLLVELEEREGVRVPSQLITKGLNVIRVDVSIAECVDEFTWLQSTDLGKHASEQGITCYVEGYAKSKVARSLIHLAGEFSIGRHVKLS